MQNSNAVVKWIKDKVNDCYKMSHSHLITIEKVNRHYFEL